MKIDYCPKCHKAGLKYASNRDEALNGRFQYEVKMIYPPEGYGTAKWCPRCKEWVKPENHPYIGRGGN